MINYQGLLAMSSNRDLLIQEIESLPTELHSEVLDFIRVIKVNHEKKQIPGGKGIIKGSKAQDLLEFAGSWAGNDI